MKKTFTKKEFFESIQYSIYCYSFELDPNNIEVREKYKQFWEKEASQEHYGDCIKQNCPCIRCQADWINSCALNASNILWDLHR